MKLTELKNESKALTRKELAEYYGVNVKTIWRWLKRAGVEVKKNSRITPRELTAIVAVLGE